MKSLSVVLVIISGAVASHAGEEPEWKEFLCKEGRFKVLMPGIPKQEEVETESDFGPSLLHMNTVEAGGSFYGAHFNDFPEAVKSVSLEQFYDSSRDVAAANMRGKVIGEEDVKLGDHPGREVRIEVNGGKHLFRSRVFLVGTRLHQIVVFGTKKAATSEDADKFLDSLKLID